MGSLATLLRLGARMSGAAAGGISAAKCSAAAGTATGAWRSALHRSGGGGSGTLNPITS